MNVNLENKLEGKLKELLSFLRQR